MASRIWIGIVAIALAAGVLLSPGVSRAGAYEDFFKSVERGDANTVRSLLQRGFDPNTPDAQGQVALYLALRDESNEVAELLLAHPDLRADTANGAGETPLMMAALRGRLDWVKRLVDRGAAINRSGWAPLHYACSGPQPLVVAWLVERGAAIDARAPNGTTALMMAAGYGAQDAATLLLELGADAQARNDQGVLAADFARRAGRDALARRLEKRGGN